MPSFGYACACSEYNGDSDSSAITQPIGFSECITQPIGFSECIGIAVRFAKCFAFTVSLFESRCIAERFCLSESIGKPITQSVANADSQRKRSRDLCKRGIHGQC